MIDTHPGYLVALIVAVVLMLGIGIWVARRNTSGEDFLLAGRRLGTPLLMGTTLATLVGTGSSLGAVGFAYENGWAGALYGLGGALGTFLLLVLFADVRKYGFMTYAEEMSYYFGANMFIKGLVSLLMLLASVGWLGAHILGGSIYLSYLTGMGDTSAKIVVALSFGLYTIVGGYLAVVITDAIQGFILFLGFTVLAALAFVHVGGMSGIRENAPEEGLSLLGVEAVGPIPALSLAVVVAIGVLATPSFRQRIYSAADVKTVRRSFLIAGLLFLAFSILPALAGLTAASMEPGLENADMAFPYLATTLFPLWLGAFLLVAGLSATMSSGDSDAVAGVTILLRDVVQIFTGRVPRRENMVWLSRVALALVLTGALVGALVATTIIDYITTMVSTILTGLFAASVLGRFWSRATWVGGVAAMVGGSATALVVNNVDSFAEFWGNAVIPSLAAAFLCGIVFSLVTRPSRVTSEEALRILAAERAVMDVGTSVRAGEGSGDKAES
ncbi:sodium:solute symporter family protein [Spiractinospora alimapuensis]|uniref:sodium:solute symporter family protein n=1 Tax=Spiractinospora alimapuensis TaxID=2820884 RepID=UPI001F484D74|nr:sodium:solute symporter family protein [Spiractinospora alimapuensis]QVQ50094.1 sodium:solute symporter family protein [Spiractinospora alimapuensis]